MQNPFGGFSFFYYFIIFNPKLRGSTIIYETNLVHKSGYQHNLISGWWEHSPEGQSSLQWFTLIYYIK